MYHIEYPLVLLLLPLPLIVHYFLPHKKFYSGQGLRVPFYHKMSAISSHYKSHLTKTERLLLYLMWLFFVLALAKPMWAGPPQLIRQEGRSLMLALDISGSMQLKDMRYQNMPVTRLMVVKETAKKFLHKRLGDRVGLILFGSKAFLQTPLTFDSKTTLHMVDDATVGLAGQTTAIGDAIGLAVKRLLHIKKNSKALILLTDGVNNAGVISPMDAAKIAKSNHIRIYTIGLGADTMTVHGIFGDNIINPSKDLDEKTLKEISSLTGGVFFRARNIADLQKVYATINQLEPTAEKSKFTRPLVAYYFYPLLLSFSCLLLLICSPLLGGIKLAALRRVYV